jgi:nitrogen fixation/metabolism regulation signal transduction histidine kinase
MATSPKRRLNFDQRVLALALASGVPGSCAALVLLSTGDFSAKVQWTLGLFVVISWLSFAYAARNSVVHPLQTLANLLGALREEDFSFRARGSDRDDSMSDVLREVNALATTLRAQRLGAVEATALLQTVMAEIDVAVFTFDGQHRLKLVNRSGERLLARPAERLLDRTAEEIGLGSVLEAEAAVIEHSFPGGSGRWEARRDTFRQEGLPHQLLVLSDVSRALREEERQAWRRLIRVIGHELNNSLTPIKSIAQSLASLLERDPRPDDLDEDVKRGLHVIGERSESLARFTQAYAHLARLPSPQLKPLSLRELIRRVAGLETRMDIGLAEGGEVEIVADVDQLEQLLINLVRNAVDAAQETGGGVRIGWRVPIPVFRQLEVWVEDEGPGLSNTANLFVPFFTTKPHGSGIGLLLCRQIAEAHGGTLLLENRRDRTGCRARLRLPAPARSRHALGRAGSTLASILQ